MKQRLWGSHTAQPSASGGLAGPQMDRSDTRACELRGPFPLKDP